MGLSWRLTGIGIADTSGTFVTRAVDSLQLGFAGIEGDRHAGLTVPAGERHTWAPKGAEVRNTRQLSLVSTAELAHVRDALQVSRLDWQWLGANLVLDDAPQLTSTAPSTRLVFPSGAIVVVDGVNEPCRQAGKAIVEGLGAEPKLASTFVKAAYRRRGLVGWVERPGLVERGMAVQVIAR